MVADFDWPNFDRNEDLGKVHVPYELFQVEESVPTGTNLVITRLRTQAGRLDLNAIRTGSVGILTPLRSLFREIAGGKDVALADVTSDSGFILNVQAVDQDSDSGDVTQKILDAFVLRASLSLSNDKVDLRVYRRGSRESYLKIVDTYPNEIKDLHADIRFFPRRKGTFTDLPIDGRRAQSWISDNHGVAVFDRGFRVPPYGSPRDDWLQLQTDAARNRRDPRSELAKKHFAMPDSVRAAPSQNWMLRLPQSLQLVGLVQVEGRRTEQLSPDQAVEGLIASADREGFVENRAFEQLHDLVRGAVEAIAFVDRKLQMEAEEAHRLWLVETIQDQTRAAIAEVQANPDIAAPDKARIVSALAQTRHLALRQQEASREREQQLEVMSLLGVVAGFMTHEFGAALQELKDAQKKLVKLAGTMPDFKLKATRFTDHIEKLKEFATYSSGYIHGAHSMPSKPYPVRPRLRQVKRAFGKYADERNIKVEISAEPDLMAPLVPVSLYNGLALNLYTNALKAVTAKAGEQWGKMAFRAWNEGLWHYLEVSDTGIGIPTALYERVFDPLFTTTRSRNDPLGSGMGLGLTLVRRGVEAFGGHADLVIPSGDFATCIRVRLPVSAKGSRA